ncbi:MAG: hypothetical protein IKY78_04415 [Clostridia bacterium]|nr:hypothetical protein [Clostridia bacterium]
MGMLDIFKKKNTHQNTTTFQLTIQNDVLTNEQRENFVFSCLRKGIKLNREMVSDLSLGEILSVVFVTSNCDLSTYPHTAKEIQEHNRGFMLSMAADWLKHNDFFVIEDVSHKLIKMSNNGIIFTCVYSSLDLAKKAANGCIGLTVQRISTNKPDFWKTLLSQGIVQVVADNSPITLTAQGCLIYAMATIADSSDNKVQTINEAAVKCNFTVEQQHEWLSVLSRTIPTIMIGGNPLCVDHHLHPRMLEEAGNMLNTVGRIAFEVSQTLSITNIEKALNTSSIDDLITSYYILREYGSMIKEPYCDALKQKNEYILTVIKKKKPDFHA